MRVSEGIEYFPAGAIMPDQLDELLRSYAFRHGDTYGSYLAADPGWETFWCRDRRGVIRFVRWAGRYVMIVSGLLAEPEDQETLLVDFLRFAKANHLHVSFFNISRDHLDLFRRHNFQVTKFGEEPVVRLDKTSWRGKDYEWVRRQESYCKRQGVKFLEIIPDPADPVYRDCVAPELEEISRQHIASTFHGREMQYFVGSSDAMGLGQKRLFVARRDSRIEAFVVCNPCLSGTMWAVEMYRRRSESTRGVIPFTILQAMRQFKEEGVDYCSLSLIPFLRCDTALTGDSWIARPTFNFMWRHVAWIFDFRGIYHFKSRFRPEYRDLYLVAQPKASVPSVLAVGFTWGLLRFNPWRLLTHGHGKSKKKDKRKSLATPEQSRRVLRRLKRPVEPSGPAQGVSGSDPGVRSATDVCLNEPVSAP